MARVKDKFAIGRYFLGPMSLGFRTGEHRYLEPDYLAPKTNLETPLSQAFCQVPLRVLSILLYIKYHLHKKLVSSSS